MNKKEVISDLRSIFIMYIIFFLLCAFVVSASFLLFFRSIELSADQVKHAAPMVFINILIITTIFVAFDTIRRRITVDRPVRQIQKALNKITEGNFDIKLDSQGSSASFAEIMTSINKMTKELSGVETLRTDFISNVSHEMKTPLSIISNYGTLLQEDSISDAQRKEYGLAVTNSAKRLAELITNILKLNHLENQEIYTQVREYNLSEQLCECLLQFEHVWEENNIQIEIDIAEDIIVKADAELLFLVWNNLLSNAFKFTKKDGKVKISLSEKNKKAIISITDTGCGMTEEVGKYIFEKFYQGDTSHATQGNGLGLALVKRILDITGSEIVVNSSIGVGSTFTVNLGGNTDAKI